MAKAPKFLKKYFWDIDFDKLDYRAHPRYVIERILEYGDKSAISWMLKSFSRAEVVGALKISRTLSPKSANFWSLILNVRKDTIRCLQKSFREIRRQFWPY